MIIFVEGNNGAGKTAFCEALYGMLVSEDPQTSHLKVCYIPDPTKKAEIDLSRDTCSECAFASLVETFRLHLESDRVAVRESENGLFVIKERSVFTARQVAFLTLLDVMLPIEEMIFSRICERLHDPRRPTDITVYIRTDPNVCYRRIHGSTVENGEERMNQLVGLNVRPETTALENNKQEMNRLTGLHFKHETALLANSGHVYQINGNTFDPRNVNSLCCVQGFGQIIQTHKLFDRFRDEKEYQRTTTEGSDNLSRWGLIITLEGNFRAGKSTMAETLYRKLDRLYPGNVVRLGVSWTDFYDVDLFDFLVSQPRRWSFAFFAFALVESAYIDQVALEHAKNGKIVLKEHSTFGIGNVFSDAFTDQMGEREAQYLRALYSTVGDPLAAVTDDRVPVVTLYVRTNPEICNERLSTSSNTGESFQQHINGVNERLEKIFGSTTSDKTIVANGNAFDPECVTSIRVHDKEEAVVDMLTQLIHNNSQS